MSKEIVTGIYEAFGRGDLAGVLSVMADGVQWEKAGKAPFSGHREGRDGVQEFFAELLGAVRIEMFEVDAVVGDGEHVLAMGRERCTVRRTGRSYEQHWAHAFRVREGKVVAVRLYEDTYAQAVAFG